MKRGYTSIQWLFPRCLTMDSVLACVWSLDTHALHISGHSLWISVQYFGLWAQLPVFWALSSVSSPQGTETGSSSAVPPWAFNGNFVGIIWDKESSPQMLPQVKEYHSIVYLHLYNIFYVSIVWTRWVSQFFCIILNLILKQEVSLFLSKINSSLLFDSDPLLSCLLLELSSQK